MWLGKVAKRTDVATTTQAILATVTTFAACFTIAVQILAKFVDDAADDQILESNYALSFLSFLSFLSSFLLFKTESF